MSRLALFPACLASAALLHALPFVALPDGGTEAEGSGGTGQITLVAASAELTQQVSKWQRPQEITTQVPAVVQPAPIANPQPVPSASPSSVPDLPTSALAVLAPAAQAEAVPENPHPHRRRLLPHRLRLRRLLRHRLRQPRRPNRRQQLRLRQRQNRQRLRWP